MSRILILILFLVWLMWQPGEFGAEPPVWPSLPVFFGFYALLVLTMGVWARWLARRVARANFPRSLRRFNFTMEAARILVAAWFAVGVFYLGWAAAVVDVFHSAGLRQTLPGVLLGTLPALLAWAGLWWSQYPADRALREQNLLTLLDAELPLHAPPGFRSYFLTNLRLQLMFMGVPVLLIVLGHDVGMIGIRWAGIRGTAADTWEFAAWILSAGLFFLVAPEVLRRVLHTEPLPDSPLRRRLDALCRRTGVRYRDVLVWKTDHNMGNAAVMGFVPRVRYILLSDLLLERMPDDEIEAVFAHEVGHIVHRHMAWYVVFIFVLTLINAGPGNWLGAELATRLGWHGIQHLIVAASVLVNFLLLFGFVSRRFERQADVYAARTMQMHRAPAPLIGGASGAGVFNHAGELAVAGVVAAGATAPAAGATGVLAGTAAGLFPGPASPLPRSYVGQFGATLFGSALRRVAVVNNIPVGARSWCHGSIEKRMQYLQGLSADPELTDRFDRFMFWMYAAMLAAAFLAGGAFAVTGM